MKKIISFFLAVLIMLSLMPVTVFAEENPICNYYGENEETAIPEEERFNAYISQMFSTDNIAVFSTEARRRLSEEEKVLYDAVVPVFRQIANGQRASAIINVGQDFYFDGAYRQPDVRVTINNLDFDKICQVLEALQADLPYETYWYDGCMIYQFGQRVGLHCYVETKYQGADRHTANTSLTGAAAKAVANAQSIIKKYTSATDYDKLVGYKNEICKLVSYNYSAPGIGSSVDSDPWTLIYVFDGDPNTNVVCEGYSEAFMYLCDNTEFNGDVICYAVSGRMDGGGHKWNIVSIGGKNYLVDVTNSDSGMIGSDGSLFMTGGTGSITDGYDVRTKYYSIPYEYYPDVIDMWGTGDDSILNLQKTAFNPSTTIPSKKPCKDGHTAGAAVTENQIATSCEEPGSYDSVVYCTVSSCKTELSRTKKILPATGHTQNTAVTENKTAASCEKDGSYESVIYCKTCKKELSRKHHTIKSTGHKFGSFISAGNNTMVRECSVCHKKETIGEIIRLRGKTRYDTSFEIANATKASMGISKFNNIIIATGKNFADALSGSYLAKVKNAPILLSSGSEKNNNLLKEYVANNLATGGTVYILGDDSAVPKTLDNVLSGYKIKRLSGKNRFVTNIEILKEAGVKNEEIIVATGYNFADSLSASAVGKPILLVSNNRGSLTNEQKAYLSTLGTKKYYIVGGTSAVSDKLAAEISGYGNIERISGKTRYRTSVAIAERFFSDPTKAVLAYAENFPDGLCGGPLSLTLDAPLILTKTGKQAAAKAYVQSEKITGGYVLGSGELINDETAIDIFKRNLAVTPTIKPVITPTPTPTPTPAITPTPTPEPTPASTVKISMTAYPVYIKKGNSFSITGTIKSNYKITEAAGAIYDANGKKVQGVSVKPNATSVNIGTSNINNKIYFGKLALGTYTLKIAAKDAEGGYAEWTKKFTVNPSTLKISMTKTPGTITKGKSFSIEGKVTSDSKITAVAGAIIDANGTKVQQVSVKPNATSLTIATSNINNKLYFGKLSAGTYSLKIAAKDARGSYVEWIKTFTVK